jgi:UDP-3-O-acyl-N-acetylglucosamine deacetylase
VYLFFHGSKSNFDLNILKLYGNFLKLISSSGIIFVNTFSFFGKKLDDVVFRNNDVHMAVYDAHLLKNAFEKHFESLNIKKNCEHNFEKRNYAKTIKKKNYYNF